MNCRKIQEFIITDYIDARMEDGQKGLIDQHLAQCHACNDFFLAAREKVINPFINVRGIVPNEILWTRIKQAIEEKQQEELENALKPGFWEKLRLAIHVPRPALAIATIVIMIFMIGSTGQLFLGSPIVKINGPDQVSYISSLIDEPSDIGSNNGSDPQTPIEKYFL